MMKTILLCGCDGKMGQVIARCVTERTDCRIAAGIDKTGAVLNDFPVVSSPEQLEPCADVMIDFSHPSALNGLLDYALKHKMPAVFCTTGCSAEQVEQIHEAAKSIPVFHSGNMSLGINLLIALAKTAVSVLGDGFDVEIIEKHHNQKIDAPSGTALMIADAVSECMQQPAEYMYDRHAQRKKRAKNEIGIHSIRGGTIVGEHEILFAGHDETVSISHSAQSKEIFAVGAINAALFLVGKEPGLYDMNDLIRAAQ